MTTQRIITTPPPAHHVEMWRAYHFSDATYRRAGAVFGLTTEAARQAERRITRRLRRFFSRRDDASYPETLRDVLEGIEVIAHGGSYDITLRSGAYELVLEDVLKPRRPRAPGHPRSGMFAYHNCTRCDHGRLPCRQGQHNTCSNPIARND